VAAPTGAPDRLDRTGRMAAAKLAQGHARREPGAVRRIAFMWFLGVLRDRLGALEDKFFATLFLGSGLMFLGMMFIAASAGGGLV
jgi:hypothetical protein